MTTSAVTIDMPQPSTYGAVELKYWIRRYTVKGFIITVSLVILFFLLYIGIGVIAQSSEKAKIAPIVKIKLEDLPPPQQNADEAPPPPTQQIINTGPAARAGTPVPVPEAMIKEDLKDFATTEELARASAKGGTGDDAGGFASNIEWDKDVNVDTREEEPPPDVFIPVEKEPVVDLEKLQEKIVYPDLARRAGIEGKVIVRVLIGKDGKVKKQLIEYTDSDLLTEAAKQAITKYGTFTPGIQNGQPVTCWVSIPIQFKLR